MCFGSSYSPPPPPPKPAAPPAPPVRMTEQIKTAADEPKRRKPGQRFSLRIPRQGSTTTGASKGGGSGVGY